MVPNGGVIGAKVSTSSTSAPGVWNLRDAVPIIGADPPIWPTAQDASIASVVGLWHFQPNSAEIVATGSELSIFKNRGTSSVSIGVGSASSAFTGRFDSATKKFGTHSFKLGGTVVPYTAVTSDFQMGTGDFTIEGWFYFNSLTSAPIVMDFRPASTNGAYPALYVNSSGSLRYYVNTADRITGANSGVTTGAWHHIAVARTSTSTYLWLNGVQQGSTFSDSTNYNGSNTRLYVGVTGTVLAVLDGYVQEIRITKGVCRYSASFTPSVTRFPDW